GTLELVRQLWERDIVPIFLSSDYVFDGKRTDGYDDKAPVSPGTEYGRQKAAVEKFLAESGRSHLVLRLSKVFGLEKGDGTLLDEMAASLMSGRPVAAARDQVFCPTWVVDLVKAIMEVQVRGLRGIVNLCSPQPWSRYELARVVARTLRV